MNYYKFFRPFVFLLDAERAHNLAIYALKRNLIPTSKNIIPSNIKSKIFGIDFASPVGLAAGFDKNAECIENLSKFNFGFLETGTVTPFAQTGNTGKRIFRIENENAVINRLGFNNKGLDEFLQNYQNSCKNIPIGINIGANKDSKNKIQDYITGLEACYSFASYITVNISSPNTPGLRNLQDDKNISELLKNLNTYRIELKNLHNKNTPILLKIAPDLSDISLEKILGHVLENQIDGIIISNTTIDKKTLANRWKAQEGGLSGRPLFEPSLNMLRKTAKMLEGRIPIIGVGGIESAETAYTKIKSGANLLQIYTALVYNGFELIDNINFGISKLLERDGFKNIQEAVGIEIS